MSDGEREAPDPSAKFQLFRWGYSDGARGSYPAACDKVRQTYKEWQLGFKMGQEDRARRLKAAMMHYGYKPSPLREENTHGDA